MSSQLKTAIMVGVITFVIGLFVITAMFASHERGEFDSMVGKSVIVGNDTVQVTGVNVETHLLVLSNGKSIGLDYAQQNKSDK